MTEGCSFNSCSFCSFYRDRPFRIKKPDEFRKHIQDVKSYLGKGLSLRRTIFLGDANALVAPMPGLLSLIDTIHNEYDVEAIGGLYGFLDGFSGEKKTSSDYEMLAKKGLKRVYIGVESGSPELLSFLRKPGRIEDAIEAVRSMKAGGISVGIIILLGAGGKKYSRAHIDQTVEAINSMSLDLDDIIYFSELIETEGIPYVKDAYNSNLGTLSPKERQDQGSEIERRLIFSDDGGVPHMARYDIREFVY
jgi:radical SAM superfamily enzyme YgiQ (UPF0313 family)